MPLYNFAPTYRQGGSVKFLLTTSYMYAVHQVSNKINKTIANTHFWRYFVENNPLGNLIVFIKVTNTKAKEGFYA
jgi:hypothetical protein